MAARRARNSSGVITRCFARPSRSFLMRYEMRPPGKRRITHGLWVETDEASRCETVPTGLLVSEDDAVFVEPIALLLRRVVGAISTQLIAQRKPETGPTHGISHGRRDTPRSRCTCSGFVFWPALSARSANGRHHHGARSRARGHHLGDHMARLRAIRRSSASSRRGRSHAFAPWKSVSRCARSRTRPSGAP